MNKYDIALASAAFLIALMSSLLLSGAQVGFTPDGAYALNIAQNLADGEGQVSKRISIDTIPAAARPVITKPPLFPLVVAAVITIGVPPKIAGQVITLLSFALSIATLYLLARLYIPRLPALIVSALHAIQMSGLGWSVLIHEQWLFILMMYISLLILVKLREQPEDTSKWAWVLLGISVAAAILSSYQGLPLVITVSAIVIIDTVRQKCSWKQMCLYAGGMAALGLVPLVRFLNYFAQGTRPGFITGSDPTWYSIGVGLIHTLQIDYFGQLFFWLGDRSSTDVFILATSLGLLLFVMLLASEKRNIMPVSAFIICYLAILVIRFSINGVPYLEKRFVLSIEGLLILVIAVALIHGINSSKRYFRIVAITASSLLIMLFVSGQFQRYIKFSEKIAASGGSLEYCPAPTTIDWVKKNINPGSVIMSPQCGYQILAETNDYYWLPIPPSDEYITSTKYQERWDEEDILRISKATGTGWIVILSGKKIDPKFENPGYGPFVSKLMEGFDSNDKIRKIVTLPDGIVYRVFYN
ncbi:ArnT family glycosyltransferase [Pseudomonadota bacterium]